MATAYLLKIQIIKFVLAKYIAIHLIREYRTEGNFGSGKIWRICCKTHIGGIKFGESSHPQTKHYTAKLQRNF